MSLIVDTLEGTIDRVAVAIDRIRAHTPEEGLYVAFSSGKDSIVALWIVEQSGVKFDAHMNLTTVDPPELVRFAREHYPQVAMERPDTSMFKLIVKKHYPPTRKVRYCCDYLKERGGSGRIIVTGIRWEESSRRAQRGMFEACKYGRGKRYLHPLIDWSTSDVWELIHREGLPYPSLYDPPDSMRRVGCVMCPLTGNMAKEAERWPKIASMYRRACRKSFDEYFATRENVKWKDGDEMYEWWVSGAKKTCDDPQLFPMDN